MSELLNKVNEILTEKNEKIIPENIKKDVQIFDVVGTHEGGGSYPTNIIGISAENSLEILNNQTELIQYYLQNEQDFMNLYGYKFEIHNLETSSYYNHYAEISIAPAFPCLICVSEGIDDNRCYFNPDYTALFVNIANSIGHPELYTNFMESWKLNLDELLQLNGWMYYYTEVQEVEEPIVFERCNASYCYSDTINNIFSGNTDISNSKLENFVDFDKMKLNVQISDYPSGVSKLHETSDLNGHYINRECGGQDGAMSNEIMKDKIAFTRFGKTVGEMENLRSVVLKDDEATLEYNHGYLYVNNLYAIPSAIPQYYAFVKNSSRLSINGENHLAISASDIAEEIDLTPEVIKKDVMILGIQGTYGGGSGDTSDATAEASDIAGNKTAYIKNGKVTGTLVDYRETANICYLTPYETEEDLSEDTLEIKLKADLENYSPGIIIDDTSEVRCNLDFSDVVDAIGLTPSVIKKGVTVLGVTGTYEGGTEDPVIEINYEDAFALDFNNLTSQIRLAFANYLNDYITTGGSAPSGIIKVDCKYGGEDAELCIGSIEDDIHLFVEVQNKVHSVCVILEEGEESSAEIPDHMKLSKFLELLEFAETEYSSSAAEKIEVFAANELGEIEIKLETSTHTGTYEMRADYLIDIGG